MAAELGRQPARHASLAALVTQLRRHSARYVLTAVRHGAGDADTQRLLQALRALGVPEAPRPVLSPLDHVGLGMIQLGLMSGGMPAPGLPSALLLSGSVPPQPLLLPVVQGTHEAAKRMRLPVQYTLFAGDGTAACKDHVDHRRGWIEITSVGWP